MSEQPIITILSSLVSILGLWYLLFWLYRDYRVDLFRQEMFCLRDRLFDEAAAGLIGFDHPAYGMLRASMNGFIRFAHRMTLLQALIFLLLARRPSDRFEKRWAAASRGLGEAARGRLDEYLFRMNVLVIKHLVLGSPFMVLVMVLTVVAPILVWLVGRFCMRQLLASLRRPLGRIDSAALAFGH